MAGGATGVGGICDNLPEDADGTEDKSTMVDSHSIIKKVAHIYAEQLMSDIKLVVDGTEYPAHRVILCASSEVFQVMLMNPEWNESSKRSIDLVEEPCCAAVFPQFIRYLYLGNVEISLHTAMPMLALADKYDVKDLTRLCVSYMEKNIAKAATQGFLVSWLQYTLTFNPMHAALTEALKRFLKWNIEMVAESRDFVEMDTNIMALLLQQHDIVVQSEYKLFQILHSWLAHRKQQLDADDSLTPAERSAMFERIVECTVTHIRFAMMCPRELSLVVLLPLLKCCRAFIMRRIAIGLSYNANQLAHVREVRATPGDELQFTPRLYCNDTWSVRINVDKFVEVADYTNYVLCFFSQRKMCDSEDASSLTWEVEFFPRGVKYDKAKIIWGEMLPEHALKTVRLRVTCKNPTYSEERFKIAVLITGVQNNINHIRTLHERTEYFTHATCTWNLDNLLPFEELENMSLNLSPHLIGPRRNTLSIQVIIEPMGPFTCRDAPPFQF